MSRQAKLAVSINSTDISKNINGVNLSFTYTDNATENVDDLSLTIENRDGRWLNEWFPLVGDNIEAKIITTDWSGSLDCGEFIIDDISFSGGSGSTMSIKAVAVDVGNDFNDTKKNRSWENASIIDIASSLCDKAKIPMEYETGYNPTLSFVSQAGKSDRDFLYDLCKKYGLTLKMYSNRVFIYDMEDMESGGAGARLGVSDMLSWSAKMTINEAGYSSVTVKYTNSNGQLLEYKHEVKGKTPKGYAYTVRVSSLAEAQRVAKSKLRELNVGEVTLSCTIAGDTDRVSGCTIPVEGLGNFDGTYFVDKATHTVGGGYTTALEMHRIENYAVVTQGEAPGQITEGSMVRIVGDYYSTGEKIPDWVKAIPHKVVQAEPTKVLLGGEGGINSWVNIADVVLAE